MTTRKIEENINNGVDLGVDIDIFPLDTWNGNLEEAKKEVRHIRKNMFLLGLSKIKKADSRNPIKRFVKGIIAVFCKMKGSDYFIKRIIKTSRKTPIEGSSFVGGKAWCIYGECEIIPKSVFESTVLVEFEDVTFPAPVGYDIYLRSLYGDYREDPPIDKQKTHHSFTAYRL